MIPNKILTLSSSAVALTLAIGAGASCHRVPNTFFIPPIQSPAYGAEHVAADMIYIEGGKLDGKDLPSFFLDRTEVTSMAYQECVVAEKCEKTDSAEDCNGKRHTHPINCVSYQDAEAYCEWRGDRLPTAAEWIWAAQGREEHRRYPWGYKNASCDVAIIPEYPRRVGPNASYGCGAGLTWPVGSRPAGATRDGILDMIGNVAEWTGTTLGRSAVVLGGGWSYGPPRHVSDHYLRDHALEGSGAGFRCARDVQPVRE